MAIKFICFVVLLFICTAIVQSQTTPTSFSVLFNTTKGDIVLQVNTSNCPIGAAHFYELVQDQYYNENAFFRVIQTPKPFVAQWGISGNPIISEKFNVTIEDDPVVLSNIAGTVAYAAEMGSNGLACCRTTQLYINFNNNSFLDPMGFAPFGVITSGFNNAMQIYSGYGQEPDQTLIYEDGNSYLESNYPLLDYIITATIINEQW
ncbi:cyclophilin-type peptidylprolyl cis-trans isomerase [Tieghemostelium lacteum]|uniref:peptidylprolyl isomerase n=1 Tax=Tieghemostelium lacteum TaxID=361077 RepID=A0A151ZRR1_TIELA|nr:cyclophilin-type peptidylprolyl cis-trans isomerase [Tieghemostelium lacteum]|eukprot:KYQ96667.1 cyclophilin-type peptidylprolyl cis-trans isomerase [Tieghemostelium lacteum]